MEPPVTTSPENRLTPSRWAFESRPFLVEPKPFFDAMADDSLRFDARDHHLRVTLAVALRFLILLLALELEDKHFVRATVIFDLRADLRAVSRGRGAGVD